MEFLIPPDDSIIPNPEHVVSDELLEKTQAAADFLRSNMGHIERFTRRVEELGRSGRGTVITLIDVDDPVGGILADILMPGHDWQAYRDAGQMPVAQGLALKNELPEFLEDVGYGIAARELAQTDDLMVLVLKARVALVVDARFTPPS